MSKVQLTTNHGVIVIELNAEKAPKTVANFIEYVKAGHYDGTIFHRVIKNFMIQGGGHLVGMKEKSKSLNAPITNEADNGLKNNKYTLAMARTSDPHSATAQFFINVKDNPFLDPTIIPDGDPVPLFTYQGKTYTNIPRAQLLRHPALAGYTVFGKVISGMDVIDKIRATPTGAAGPFAGDVPQKTVLIQSARQIK